MHHRVSIGSSIPLRLGLLAGVALVLAPDLASAQAQASGVEAVVVTARRREEKAQKVPVTVTVLAGKTLAQNNQNNLQDIVSDVPEADFRTSSSNKDRTLFIRGVGTISTSPGVEPSVSTVVDGVVLARSGQATVDLVDLEQIEVLSGPQGTLFGKNASAGAINITTAQPRPDFHAWLEGDFFGSGGDEYRASGGVTGTIAPNLTANFSALYDHFDGNVRNLYTGQEVNGYSREGFRSKFRYEGSDDFDATLAFDYLKSFDTVPNGVFVASGRESYPSGKLVPNNTLAGVLGTLGITPGPNNTNVSQNVTSTADDNNGGIGLTLNKKLGDYTLTGITAWRIWQNSQTQDYDQLASPPNTYPEIKDRGNLLFNQVSQEVRLTSPKGGLVDYVLGAYFLKAIDFETYDRNYAPAATPATVTVHGVNSFSTDGDNEAVFGEANVNLTPDFRLIAGLRVIRDGLSFESNRISSSPSAVVGIRTSLAAQNSTEVYGYSDRLGWQYDISPDANVYFTYSRGYKGPAFNVFFNNAITDTDALKPETNNSFEAGLKSNWLGNRVQFDISGFIEDFSNFQANFADQVAGAIVTRLINAGAVTSRGGQASLYVHPAAGLSLGLNALYDDAYIVRFNCPPHAATSCNVNGEPLPFAPRYKLAASGSYTAPIDERFDLRLATDYTWQSRTQDQITETPDTIQRAYGIWNGNLSLIDKPDSWRLTGVIKNILDQHYSNYLAYGSLGGVIRYVPRDAGRYFGIELRKDF